MTGPTGPTNDETPQDEHDTSETMPETRREATPRSRRATTPRKKDRRVGAKTVAVLVATVAIVGVIGGLAWAQLLSSTNVMSNQTGYSGEGGVNPDFGNAPTLVPSTITASTCSTTPSANYPAGSANSYHTIAILSVTGTCTTGDWAEVWTFTSNATGPFTGSVSFIVSTSYGSTPTTYSTTVTLSATAWTATLGGTPFLTIEVDYGTVAPPTGGIGTLSVVVTST
jgi:hypothetical protein